MTTGSLTQAFDNVVIDNLLTSFANHYHVDAVNGDDTNDGLTWERAVKTIAQAITLSNATINWGDAQGGLKEYNVIWVRPGVYAENLSFPYFCHLIGLGIRGTDTMVEIHPSSGSCFAGTSLGTHLANLWLEVDEAVPVIKCTGDESFNSTLIEDCTFHTVAAANPTGIDSVNTKFMTVRRCEFISTAPANGFAYAFYFRGGDEKYANNVIIEDCTIFAITAGIWIEDICTNSQMVIKQNVIIVPDGIGIDDNWGYSYCVDNWISATDPIDHPNGERCIANHVFTVGVGGSVEAAGTD